MSEQLKKLIQDLKEISLQEKEAIEILSDLQTQKETILRQIGNLSSLAVDSTPTSPTLVRTAVQTPKGRRSYVNRTPNKFDLCENKGAKKRTYVNKDSGAIYVVDYYHTVLDFEPGDTVLIISPTKGFDGHKALVEEIKKDWIWCRLIDNSFTSENDHFYRRANGLVIIKKHFE